MPWKPKGCVVVPIDFSDSGAPAVREALQMASSPDAVHVLHVIPDLDPVSPGTLFGNVDEAQLIEKASGFLQKFLQTHELQGVRTKIVMGDPGTKIVKYANDHSADLIVVPSHGYHGLKHLLLGSVAERIIRHAHCPVYVLRRHDAE